MKITTSSDVSRIDSFEDFKRFVGAFTDQAKTAINGRISVSDNLDGQVSSVTFSASNTDTAVDHTLDRIAPSYIVLNASAALIVYNGSADNTSKRTYLRASATGTVSLFLF